VIRICPLSSQHYNLSGRTDKFKGHVLNFKRGPIL
jgi:hypothetical protein